MTLRTIFTATLTRFRLHGELQTAAASFERVGEQLADACADGMERGFNRRMTERFSGLLAIEEQPVDVEFSKSPDKPKRRKAAR